MHQDKNVNPLPYLGDNTTEKVQAAKLFNKLYVDGNYDVKDGLYTITPNIRKSSNGNLIASKTFSGSDVLKMLDSISIYIREQVGVTEVKRAQYVDLEIQEFTSNSLKAIEQFCKGNNNKAIAIDSTFALAYLFKATRNIYFNQGKFEEQFNIDKAFDNRLKLPLDRQLQILIWKHIAYEEWEKAEELVKLQLAIEPNNELYVNLLYQIYSETKQVKAYLDFAKRRFDNELSASTGQSYADALIINGNYKKCIDEIDKFLLFKPNDNFIFFMKLVPQILNDDLKEARKTLKKVTVLHPEWEYITNLYDSTLSYLERHPKSNTDLSFFEGEFRSLKSELEFRFWIKNNVLLHSSPNQVMWPVIRSGDAKLTIVFGNPNWLCTANYLQNKDGKTYAILFEQYDTKNPLKEFTFKLDESIKKAESLLVKGDLVNAESVYIDAVANNPEHFYLKDALAHITYMKETDSLALQKQYQEVEGTYGPSKFWVANGKLFYKRADAWARIQLLPISKNRYMNLTRMQDNVVFEYKDGKVVATLSWQFNIEKKEWIKLDDERNYFSKD